MMAHSANRKTIRLSWRLNETIAARREIVGADVSPTREAVEFVAEQLEVTCNLDLAFFLASAY